VKKQVGIIKKELGWNGDQVENLPPGFDYEKIECYMQGVRDYIKYIKRGFTRPTHLASMDIRNHRMTREQGLDMLQEYEGKRPPSLDIFLDFIGITEEEFLKIAMSHSVAPHQHDPSKIVPGNKLHDFNVWSRDGAMPRADSEKQLERWKNQNGR
jgi:hypothetical protein